MTSAVIFRLARSKLAQRFDPRSNQPLVRQLRNRLSEGQYPSTQLHYLADFTKSTVTEIGSEDVYVGLENIDGVAGEYAVTKEKETISSAAIFKRGDILFPKLRPYLNKTHLAQFDGLCSTEFHVLKVHGAMPEYVAAMLRSETMVQLTAQLMTGNTLPRLQTADIENLAIPLPTMTVQQQVVDLMRQAYAEKKRLEDEAAKLLAGVDGVMYRALGLAVIEPITDSIQTRIFTAKLNQLSGNIFDPKTHRPSSIALLASLNESTHPRTTLRSVVTHRMAGDWGEDEDWSDEFETHTKCLVIRGTEFDNQFNLRIENGREKYRRVQSAKLSRMRVEVGDILVEKSGGSPDQPVGRVAILETGLLTQQSICYSNFVEKIKPDIAQVLPDYLFYYLRFVHAIGITDLLQSQTNGIRNLMIHRYLDLPVSIPSLSIQEKIIAEIGNIKMQSASLQLQANSQLNVAKAKVEKMILGEAA